MEPNDKNTNFNSDSEQEKNFPGYPPYPPSEDIYNIGKKEEFEEDTAIPKAPKGEEDIDNPGAKGFDDNLTEGNEDETDNAWSEQGYDDDFTGEDLDIPGSELDDEQEELGTEDEENNYYSLGGDNHDDTEDPDLR